MNYLPSGATTLAARERLCGSRWVGICTSCSNSPAWLSNNTSSHSAEQVVQHTLIINLEMSLENETEWSVTPQLAQKAEDITERSLNKADYGQARVTKCHSKTRGQSPYPNPPTSKTSISQITGELFQMLLKATAYSFVFIFPWYWSHKEATLSATLEA